MHADEVICKCKMEYPLHEDVFAAIKQGRPPDNILQLSHTRHLPDHDSGSNRLVGDVFGVPQIFLIHHSLLLEAIQSNHIKLVETLLTEGHYDVHSVYTKRMKMPAMHLACYLGNKEVVKMLVEQKVEVHGFAMAPDGLFKPPLALAFRHDEISLMEMMLPSFLAKKEIYTRTPLHLACEEGAYQCAQQLIEQYPEDVNAADFSGFTPLMMSVRQDLRFVELLLKNNANVHSRTPDKGRQCLHMLFCKTVGGPRMFLPVDACKMADQLLCAGADVNKMDVYLETPLSLLCSQIATELHQFTFNKFPYSLETHHQIIRDCVHLLLSSGAKLNLETGVLPFNVVMNGVRAAMEAMIGRSWTNKEDASNFKSTLDFSLELLDLLARRGADPDSLNVYLLSPLTQMFVYINACRFVEDSMWEYVWNDVRSIFLLLLRSGARDCSLREAFWYVPYRTDVISMVLNAYPHTTHQVQLWSACRPVRDPSKQDADLMHHREWARELASSPRTLRQASRAVICDILRYKLVQSVPQLPLPSLIQEYLLSFEG